MTSISLTTLLASMPLVMVTYKAPTMTNLAFMIGIGVTGTLGQYASISAYRLADISAIAPVLYVRIVIATAIGYLVFSEAIEPLTIFGAAIVTASALYITIRESKLARERESV